MELKHKNYKMMIIIINESQQRRLEEFLDSVKFYFYTIEHKVERIMSAKLKHKNNSLWPGTDSVFTLMVPNIRLDSLLSQLKAFRMALPEGVIMSAGIIPIEAIVPAFYTEDIPYDTSLTEMLKQLYVR